jgi:hypothetical protein
MAAVRTDEGENGLNEGHRLTAGEPRVAWRLTVRVWREAEEIGPGRESAIRAECLMPGPTRAATTTPPAGSLQGMLQGLTWYGCCFTPGQNRGR